MMMKYYASDELRGGLCWPEGKVHSWGVEGTIDRVAAGMVTGQYHISFWPDRVVQTSAVNGMRETLVSGFIRRGLCCKWVRWEMEQDDVMVVSLRGLDIRHIELLHLGTGWCITWSIFDTDYESFRKGMVTYLGMCLPSGGTWREGTFDRWAIEGVREVGERECEEWSKYYFQHKKFEQSRWDDLGAEDWMGTGVAMFDLGRNVGGVGM